MRTPKVTVLMTVYNGERYLKECIDSVLNQTFKDFEFLIIDDCSADNSRDIIRSYKDDRVRIIENKDNLNQVRSLNIGLDYARSRYIARMDQDDVMLKDRLKSQVGFLDKRPDVTVVGTWGEVIDEKGIVFTRSRLPVRFEEIVGSVLFTGYILIHPSVAFRRDAVIEAGKYNEALSFSEDYDLWIRLLLKGHRITNIPEYLIRFRYHQKSSSRQFPEVQLNNVRTSISSFIQGIIGEGYNSELDSLSRFLVHSGLMNKEFLLNEIDAAELEKIMRLVEMILGKTAIYFNLRKKEAYRMKKVFCSRMLNLAYQASTRKERKKSLPLYLSCLRNYLFLFTKPKLYLYPIRSVL